jgi:hypothetical protein
LQKYGEKAPQIAASFNGHYVVRGGDVQALTRTKEAVDFLAWGLALYCWQRGRKGKRRDSFR